MIAFEVSATGGPILLIVSGCSGGSGLGTGSHFKENCRAVILPETIPGI